MKTKKNRWQKIGAFYKNRPFNLGRVNKFERIQNSPFIFGFSRDRIIEEYFLKVKLYKNGLPDLCMYTKIL